MHVEPSQSVPSIGALAYFDEHIPLARPYATRWLAAPPLGMWRIQACEIARLWIIVENLTETFDGYIF
jgi:hypothetical protein